MEQDNRYDKTFHDNINNNNNNNIYKVEHSWSTVRLHYC